MLHIKLVIAIYFPGGALCLSVETTLLCISYNSYNILFHSLWSYWSHTAHTSSDLTRYRSGRTGREKARAKQMLYWPRYSCSIHHHGNIAYCVSLSDERRLLRCRLIIAWALLGVDGNMSYFMILLLTMSSRLYTRPKPIFILAYHWTVIMKTSFP